MITVGISFKNFLKTAAEMAIPFRQQSFSALYVITKLNVLACLKLQDNQIIMMHPPINDIKIWVFFFSCHIFTSCAYSFDYYCYHV